jgi:hypothetical protein
LQHAVAYCALADRRDADAPFMEPFFDSRGLSLGGGPQIVGGGFPLVVVLKVENRCGGASRRQDKQMTNPRRSGTHLWRYVRASGHTS